MKVYCLMQTITDPKSGEHYDMLQTIFLEYEDAKIYKKAHPPEIRRHLHVEEWLAQ